MYINCYSKGPSIRPTYTSKIVTYDRATSQYIELPQDQQTIYEGDTHTVKLTVKATNEGTSGVFYPVFKVGLNPNVNPIQQRNNENFAFTDNGIKGDIREISISYNGSIESNEYKKFDIYCEMKFEEKNSLRNLENSDVGSFSLVKSLNVELCLENAQCDANSDLFGVQNTEKAYKINYVKGGKIEGDNTNEEPEEKKGFQAYIIAIIIVVSFLVILGGGFLIYKYAFAKNNNEVEAQEIINEDETIRKKLLANLIRNKCRQQKEQ